MDGRNVSMLIVGILIGGLAGAGAMGGAAARGHDLNLAPVQPVRAQTPDPAQGPSPKEFIPLPNTGNGPGPGQPPSVPGAGGAQDCDRILYFYQGRLYQLRPGPTPRNGGNPEFFYMQPYEGPQIPGFGPMLPGAPTPDQPPPPMLKF